MEKSKSSFIILTDFSPLVSAYGLDDDSQGLVRCGGMFIHYDNAIFPSRPKSWVRLWSRHEPAS